VGLSGEDLWLWQLQEILETRDKGREGIIMDIAWVSSSDFHHSTSVMAVLRRMWFTRLECAWQCRSPSGVAPFHNVILVPFFSCYQWRVAIEIEAGESFNKLKQLWYVTSYISR
jgi:hypothetical protein